MRRLYRKAEPGGLWSGAADGYSKDDKALGFRGFGASGFCLPAANYLSETTELYW